MPELLPVTMQTLPFMLSIQLSSNANTNSALD